MFWKRKPKQHKLLEAWWQEQNCLCAMKLAADAFGSTNRHDAISLADATADLVTEIAKIQRDLLVQFQELQSKGNLE